MGTVIKRIILYIILVIIIGYFALIIEVALLHPHTGYALKETVTKYSQLIGLFLLLFVILVPAYIVNNIFRDKENE